MKTSNLDSTFVYSPGAQHRYYNRLAFLLGLAMLVACTGDDRHDTDLVVCAHADGAPETPPPTWACEWACTSYALPHLGRGGTCAAHDSLGIEHTCMAPYELDDGQLGCCVPFHDLREPTGEMVDSVIVEAWHCDDQNGGGQ